jgi:hypothetical protein
MKPAAIGVRVHSGWSVLVAVSTSDGSPQIVRREHVILIDSSQPGAKQPYHFAEKLSLPKAERHISECTAASGRLAGAAFDRILTDLRARDFEIEGCAVLLASGHALPVLADILASHALMHAAEGEFFRNIVREAFEKLGVAVIGFRERGLDQQAADVFGDATPRVLRLVSELGRVLGPPWTADEKAAMLAAWMVLATR